MKLWAMEWKTPCPLDQAADDEGGAPSDSGAPLGYVGGSVMMVRVSHIVLLWPWR